MAMVRRISSGEDRGMTVGHQAWMPPTLPPSGGAPVKAAMAASTEIAPPGGIREMQMISGRTAVSCVAFVLKMPMAFTGSM